MDIVVVMIFSFILLVFSILRGIFIGYPLILCFLMFVWLAWRKGYSLKNILQMAYGGGKKVFIVLRIFILIGGITAAWMASGTVAAIVYYGLQLMHPSFFILYAFLITVFVSFLLGTSFGTISTVGVALMVMAKGGGVNVNLAAGAIIAGSYFGDRCSPMSSSANLVATLTKTQLYINIKNMFKTAAIPFILATILYTIFSLYQPLNLVENNMDKELIDVFFIDWRVLIPAIMILIFAAFKVDVKISMLLSITAAGLLGIFLQHHPPSELLKYIFFGYTLDFDGPLKDIMKGGGILSMWKAAIIVFVSSCLSGILEGTGMLHSIEEGLIKVQSRWKLFVSTSVVGFITAAFGCNQTISIVLTTHLMKKPYGAKNIDNHQLAVDIENTSVVMAPLIPWNIASLVPTTTLMVSATGFIPYAFYLYFIPISNIVYLKFREVIQSNKD
ncbi:Na+/H+ antiporter NhaC family protein [Natronincola ferrireducens]|uniref:Transporter, NhaC family (TC 2.A.35) n=1 Tax=Natronincola ferrireducens TaxID=393762 RepID=A0A1G9FVT9_9FIRM|nr:Na+/H+ antiporter NhaC family protein [Natronincola ferrireducens]SDK92487.1 transporter, NhaC family (TC 2.A.35) [Natronincola ferrireducens]